MDKDEIEAFLKNLKMKDLKARVLIHGQILLQMTIA